MFKVTEKPTFRWPVSFKWAANLDFEEHTFIGVFRRLPAAVLAEKAEAVQKDAYSFTSRVAFLDAVVVGFDDVDHDGTPEALREYMFADMAIVNALFTTYSNAIQGIETKNFETPPSD